MQTFFNKICLNKKAAKITLLSVVFSAFTLPVWAAGPPEPSPFSNPLAVTMIVLMIVLLIVIAILANILLGTADWKLKKKDKAASAVPMHTVMLFLFMLISPALFAQEATEETAKQVADSSIGGLAAPTFYVMAAVVFLELFIIIALLVNIKFLIKVEKEKTLHDSITSEVVKKPTINWWNKLNKFKPVEQEADIDLGHDYDGIRELDNRLPPWWLYGFYVTIVFGVIYIWRFHVSETAPLSAQEYEQSVQVAEAKIEAYLKKKGESVNENSVTLLTSTDDIAAGQKIYLNSCAACHKEKGGGEVGPNLTDDYWIHGGDIKSIFKTIKYGVDGKGMASWQSVYSPKQIAQLSSFVKSLHGTNPPNPKAPQGEIFKEEAAPATQQAIDSTAATDKKVAMN